MVSVMDGGHREGRRYRQVDIGILFSPSRIAIAMRLMIGWGVEIVESHPCAAAALVPYRISAGIAPCCFGIFGEANLDHLLQFAT